MANKELYIGTSTPKSNEVVWIRPLKSGGVALYAYVYNKWQVLKLVNGKGTLPVDDDEVIDPATPGGNYYTKDEIDEKIADILGIDADQIDELIAIVTDDDTVTGLLTEVKNKANVTKGNVFNINSVSDKNEFKVGGYGLVISPYSSSVSSDRLLIFYNHLSFTRLGLNPIDIHTFPDSDRLYVGNNPESSAQEYYHPIAYLEDIPTVTPQVQSDWNESDTTSKAYILNKPTIPTKTSDLVNDSGFLTEHQKIKTINSTTIVGDGNLDVVTGVTINNVTKTPTNGIVDLGTVLTTTTSSATSGSTTPITSGGVYTALQNYETKLSFTTSSSTSYTASRNTYYRHTNTPSSLAISLPTSSLVAGDTCAFNFTTSSSFSSLTWSNGTRKFMKDFAIEAGKTYEVVALYNGSVWLITATEFE